MNTRGDRGDGGTATVDARARGEVRRPPAGKASRALLRAAAVTGAALALAVPTSAATAAAPTAVPPGLSCDTGKHANDDYTGYALCRNDGSATQTFWVHLVCGWSPDVDGERVTLAPGRSGQSTAHCAGLGTGIGEIQVRP
ncbi:hypothetical protein AB0G71_20040 [Streptomyces sp. NPDC020403]|uniref:hypothetical protein n=1 Tax=unclassified Streptomyces TaxID=2593676 RepID=UPI0034087877